MTSRTPTRAQLGDAAIFSPEEAADLLPWRDSQAFKWLRVQGLIHEEHFADGSTGSYVIWGEVVAALRAKSVRDRALEPKRGRVVPLKRSPL